MTVTKVGWDLANTLGHKVLQSWRRRVPWGGCAYGVELVRRWYHVTQHQQEAARDVAMQRGPESTSSSQSVTESSTCWLASRPSQSWPCCDVGAPASRCHCRRRRANAEAGETTATTSAWPWRWAGLSGCLGDARWRWRRRTRRPPTLWRRWVVGVASFDVGFPMDSTWPRTTAEPTAHMSALYMLSSSSVFLVTYSLSSPLLSSGAVLREGAKAPSIRGLPSPKWNFWWV